MLLETLAQIHTIHMLSLHKENPYNMLMYNVNILTAADHFISSRSEDEKCTEFSDLYFHTFQWLLESKFLK